VKIYVCHTTGTSEHTLNVSINSVATHLAHGDRLGTCDQSCSQNKNANSLSAISESEIKIYPNPVTGAFVVKLPENMNAQEAIIMDVQGREVTRKTFTDERVLNFDLGREANGVYILQVIDGKDVYRTTITKQ
jgi:hypothetical protein